MVKQRSLKVALAEALEVVAQQYDIKYHMRVKEGLIDITVVDDAELKLSFERIAPALDIDPNWFGKKFKHKKSTFEIIGLRPSAPKNCIKIRNTVTNKEYICSKSFINIAKR